MSKKRPEHQAPADVFYNEEEARKYTTNTRMIDIQRQMTERALELLTLPEDQPCFLLDIGCGSGLSGELITEYGHFWVGLDISPAMLEVAIEREVEGDLFLSDIGQGVGFLKPGTFDGCISISALQWLCNADKKSHVPVKRLFKFFTTLYSILTRCGKVVLQFYPENPAQIELITTQAMKAGFTGGVIVDYPNSTRAKKMFLVLFAGTMLGKLPRGLGTEMGQVAQETVAYSDSRQSHWKKPQRGKPPKKSRDWILEKKQRRQKQGRSVKQDSKYTGRKRRPNF